MEIVFERKTGGETMLIAANFSTEEQSINLPYKVTKDHTPKAFKRFCTLKNELLTSPACSYFLLESNTFKFKKAIVALPLQSGTGPVILLSL